MIIFFSKNGAIDGDDGDCTAQKMKFSIKDFFSKCDQICRKLRMWSHLLEKSLMGNFIFCTSLQWVFQNFEDLLRFYGL